MCVLKTGLTVGYYHVWQLSCTELFLAVVSPYTSLRVTEVAPDVQTFQILLNLDGLVLKHGS